jgi:hypothetical protein
MKTRKTTECARVRASLAEGRRGTDEAAEAHLFVCSACRTEARLAAGWAALRASEDPRELERAESAPVDSRFVRGVLDRVRADRVNRKKARVRLAAAAALLFFFALGASQRLASSTNSSAEESYAQLVSPDLVPELPE